jgi:hypothetical protein
MGTDGRFCLSRIGGAAPRGTGVPHAGPVGTSGTLGTHEAKHSE